MNSLIRSHATAATTRSASFAATFAAVLAAAPVHSAVNMLAIGMDSEGGTVKVFDASGNERSFTPFGSGFSGGVRVAVGDISGDGTPDIIVGTGPGGGAAVRVFDGIDLRPIRDLEPFGSGFSGGVYVAAGDLNADGRADLIIGAGPGGPPIVRVIDGRSQSNLLNFMAYGDGFTGGVFVAAGDVNGDQIGDIIVGPGTGGGHVKVFNGVNGAELHSFMAYETVFNGGVSVAVGDWNGDGINDIITGPGPSAGGPHVRVFSGSTLAPIQAFFAYPSTFQGGVRVAAGDLNGDGFADVISGSGAGAAAVLNNFLAPSASNGGSFLGFGPNYLGGAFVANAVVLPVVHRDGFE